MELSVRDRIEDRGLTQLLKPKSCTRPWSLLRQPTYLQICITACNQGRCTGAALGQERATSPGADSGRRICYMLAANISYMADVWIEYKEGLDTSKAS